MSRRSISLFHRIERALETIAHGSSPLETVKRTAQFLVDSFSRDLGITGGRIYAQDNGEYELVHTFGEVDRAPIGLRVQRTYAPIEQVLDVGSVVMDRDDASLDQRLEQALGTRDCFAAIAVADGRYVLSFDFSPGDRDQSEQLIATLNIMRLAINQKLREHRMQAILEDARRIQESILPRRLPHPGDFQIAARSVPAEVVGGDFYDVITLSEGVFDVVVADATGHGLPAALQVRDVYTGLRMGLSREYKISRTLERLNRIIHRSRLATKFVSLFLAEIDLGGNVIYCNAGHPPAMLVHASGEIEWLATGGILLGPTPGARYTIGLATMGPGDLLLLYTDGITEATAAEDEDEEFGARRLVDLVTSMPDREPQAVVDRIFAAVERFTGQTLPSDDQTVVAVRRKPREIDDRRH